MPQDYNTTLNLPKTEFSMRANLPAREPAILEKWNEERLYEKILERNNDKPLFILHDGPPYANGDIHIGHALNKILKDFIVRYKNMSGFKSPYVPGWDTHGLPTELKAIKEIKLNKNTVSRLEFREKCAEFATKYINNQREQFKRLGVIGDWDHPYLTLNKDFEAKQIEVFGEMAKKGYIYKGLKPVYWCPTDETALAEAEIEYADDKCDSIYVKFKVADDKGKLFKMAGTDEVYFVIWTTTTWTLPGNVAICLGPEFDYSLVKVNSEVYVIASALVESTMKAAHIENYSVLGEINGKELEFITTKHPFLDRLSVVILGDHVTLESGTGCVHTAPGHGMEDFVVCKKYKDIPIIVPVDEKGVLTSEAGPFAGMYYKKANAAIVEELKRSGALLTVETVEHSYPHCWRCHDAVIFRATEQWFCSVEGFKDKALAAAEKVKWIPGWGKERIASMIEGRSDWCISRQRIWGVPIPIFYCSSCGKVHINDATIKSVADAFRKEGANAWYKHEAAELLPQGYKCECGSTEFTKEKDIMDVWFDSGSSYAAVLDTREGLRSPADMYLEGNDQYRGWFQSSLLTSVAVYGRAPYKSVLTHGFVIDLEGKKMSKSSGNGIVPAEVIKQYGADILRLWVASSDYQVDVRISKEILSQLSEVYRKIRNTARYILGNIYDFNPETDMVEFSQMAELDKYILSELSELVERTTKFYENFEYHGVYHSIHNFCVTQLSNFYLDVIKDRLYTEKADSLARRSAQSAMYIILDTIVRMLTPVLAYTTEEIWQNMPHRAGDNAESVMLNDFPKAADYSVCSETKEKWRKIEEIREDVKKALEEARTGKLIGSSLEADVTLYFEDEKDYSFAESCLGSLETAFIVSKVHVMKGKGGTSYGGVSGLSVNVKKAGGVKCERCWKYFEGEGDLCGRCKSIV